MYLNKKILAVIPARGGSKGLPGKNLKLLFNKPLIAWSIENALEQQILDDVVVTTDDDEIANVSQKFGAKIPFLRPVELAQDDTPIFDVISHLITNLTEKYDIISLIEPTSPLRKRFDITNALKLLINNYNSADAVISLGEIHTENPLISKMIDNGFVKPFISSELNIYQRQQLPKAYFPYGVIYAAKVANYLEEKSFYLRRAMAYYIERWQNYEIDDIYDYLIVEKLISNFAEKLKL